MRRNSSFTTSKIFGNQTSISKQDNNEYRRRPESIRQSHRKPIFDKNMYFSSVGQFSVKRPITYNESVLKIQQTTQDDFCGCEHNLDPCEHIMSLIKGLN